MLEQGWNSQMFKRTVLDEKDRVLIPRSSVCITISICSIAWNTPVAQFPKQVNEQLEIVLQDFIVKTVSSNYGTMVI